MTDKNDAMTKPLLASAPHFSPDSRVWVYVAERSLSEQETAFAEQQLSAFCRQWTAHNQQLRAASEVFGHQFVLLMVDETQAGASGCSIDKSVHFLEQLGQSIGADLFERMRFGWLDESGTLRMSRRDEFAQSVQSGHITADTPVVNTLVQTKRDLTEKWLLPYAQSWHRRMV